MNNKKLIKEIKQIAKEYNIILSEDNLFEDFEKYTNKIHWYYVSKYQKLSEQFIEKYADKVDWYYISGCQKLSESFIEKHSDKVDWQYISTHQKLSESFIEKHTDKVYWGYISRYQKLSEQFIEKYADKVDWYYISGCQKLSESFIEKHSDKVDWCIISVYQNLSESFVEKYGNKVDWSCISAYQKLSESFISKYNLTIDHKTNWLYWVKEKKLDYIKKNCPQYEIVNDEYIVAYKSVRDNYYSVFNFQYKYEVGNEYEAHCNCNSVDKNSFGLSVWTKEKALEYYDNGKLLKVHIDVDDIGTIVYNGYKIRAKKMKIISEENKSS